MPMRVTYTVLDGEILSENRGGVERDYIADPLGSTMALLNNSQTKTDTWGYWPYGEVKSRTGTTPTPFQFVGTQGYFRDTAARTYVRARHYRQDQARWLTEDPIGFEGGDRNLYRYVANHPVTERDINGMSWCCWHIRGNCYGTCCHGDPSCPPRKPRPPIPPPPRRPLPMPPCPLGWEKCDWLDETICRYDCRNHGGMEKCVVNTDSKEMECECKDGTINP